MRYSLCTPLVLALAACGGDRSPGAPPAAAPSDSVAAPAPAPATAVPAPADSAAVGGWRINPRPGVTLTPEADGFTIETGPHTVLWRADAAELQPPYTVRATFQKRTGRLHEGYGLVFGGAGLDQAEAGQTYSYFLIRGDGSFLIKRRAGAETPLVHDWTRAAAVNRDGADGGRANTLEVQVGADSSVFRVNGAEVARVPSSQLAVRGRAGLRIAHDLVLRVSGYAGGAAQ